MLKTKDYEIEFVGARKESYNSDSRKPTIEEGNLEEDLSRRDFTINTLAISLNKKNYGEIVNLFDGINDIKRKIIKVNWGSKGPPRPSRFNWGVKPPQTLL